MANVGTTGLPGATYTQDRWGEFNILINQTVLIEYLKAKIPNASKFSDNDLISIVVAQFEANKDYYKANANSLFTGSTFKTIIDIAANTNKSLSPIVYSKINSNSSGGGNSNSGNSNNGGSVITPNIVTQNPPSTTSENNTMLLIGGGLALGLVLYFIFK